jgi:hypothetical protein
VIISDKAIEEDLRNHIGKKEIYRFLKDMLENSQNILLILDKEKTGCAHANRTTNEPAFRNQGITILK